VSVRTVASAAAVTAASVLLVLSVQHQLSVQPSPLTRTPSFLTAETTSTMTMISTATTRVSMKSSQRPIRQKRVQQLQLGQFPQVSVADVVVADVVQPVAVQVQLLRAAATANRATDQ
jgi:hypothetical protein